jgi:uncharacterized protein (DUF486 family)
LLAISNIFTTFAVLVSWGIAFFEYWFSGAGEPHRLLPIQSCAIETIQEVITLSIFPVFSVFYLGESFKWNHGVASHFS